MTVQEWTMIAAELREVYMDSKFLTTKEAMGIWYKHLKDLPGGTVKAVVDQYIETDITGFPPKIAQIRSMVGELTVAESRMSANEAWGLLYDAISGYDPTNPAKRYNALPEAIRKCVTLNEFIEYGHMETSDVQTVVGSKFMSGYNIVLKRMTQDAALSSASRMALAVAQQARLQGTDHPLIEVPVKPQRIEELTA